MRLQKKNAAIMLAATNNSAFAIANVIIGLERYSSHLYDTIFIYHDGFSEADTLALKKLSNKLEFVLYTHEIFLKKCKFSGAIPDSFGRYTHMSVCRYELFNHLHDYKYCIWIDFDILIQKDISFLFDYAPWGMIKTVNPIKNAIKGKLEGISGEEICLSSGVVIVSDTIENYSSITDELYKETSKYSDVLLLPDQAILNYVSYLRQINAKAIPDKLISPPEWKVAFKEAPMIHAAGSRKRFWNEASLIVAYPEWQLNNKLWLLNGGSDYQGEIFNKYKIPYPLQAGFFVQKSRIIAIRNNIISSYNKLNGLVCSNGTWSDSIELTSSIFRKENLCINLTLKKQVTLNFFGKFKSSIIKREPILKALPATLEIKEHPEYGLTEISGEIKDTDVMTIIELISQSTIA